MRLTDAKIFYDRLAEAIHHAEMIGSETIDLSTSTAQFDDSARDELQRAIDETKRRQSDD